MDSKTCVMCALKSDVDILPVGRVLYECGQLTKEIFSDIQKLGINDSIKWRGLLHSINFQENKPARVTLIELVRIQNAQIAASLDTAEFNQQIVCICGQRASVPRLQRSSSLHDLNDSGLYSTLSEFMEVDDTDPLLVHTLRPRHRYMSLQPNMKPNFTVEKSPLRRTRSLDQFPFVRTNQNDDDEDDRSSSGSSQIDGGLQSEGTWSMMFGSNHSTIDGTNSPRDSLLLADDLDGRKSLSSEQETVYERVADCQEDVVYPEDGEETLFSMVNQKITDVYGRGDSVPPNNENISSCMNGGMSDEVDNHAEESLFSMVNQKITDVYGGSEREQEISTNENQEMIYPSDGQGTFFSMVNRRISDLDESRKSGQHDRSVSVDSDMTDSVFISETKSVSESSFPRNTESMGDDNLEGTGEDTRSAWHVRESKPPSPRRLSAADQQQTLSGRQRNILLLVTGILLAVVVLGLWCLPRYLVLGLLMLLCLQIYSQKTR